MIGEGWKDILARFVQSSNSQCGCCLTTRHGLFNCPKLWLEFVTMATDGKLGFVIPDQKLDLLKGAAIAAVRERYN
jgi:hypothetical protein